MPTQTLDPTLQEILRGRYIATLGTENADGTIHLTAVWYLFESGSLFVATSSKTQKARNVTARPKASLMVDSRKPGTERGVTASGKVEVIISVQQQFPIPTSVQCLHRLMMSRYDLRPFPGSPGTWPRLTPKPLEGDWAERPVTCCRSINGNAATFTRTEALC